jgi:PRTRC genetic system ThiF family protein
MKHYLPSALLSKQVKIALVGAGGTGSRMLENLMNLHRAMVALGHPHGLHVTLIDDDRVSPANVGRQAFYACDVGSYKAMTLINRANMAMGGLAQWDAFVGRVTTESRLNDFDMVIGAVDNRSARLAILRALESKGYGAETYWLDCGNSKSAGQVVLGQVPPNKRKKDDVWRLPHVGEMYPELIDSVLDKQEDDTPSCSLAEALEKQSLFINPAVSLFASNLLWQMFTKGEIEHHGAYVNLDSMTVMPMAIDHEVWARFGIIKDGRRRKVCQPSRKAKNKATA